MRQDLRHFDNRLDNHRWMRGKELDDIRQLFHRLQHRSIQNLHHRGINGSLLHGTLLIPVLWPRRLTQTGWPGTPRKHHVFVGEFVVLGACVLLSPWERCAGPWSSCRLSGEVLTPGPLRSTAAHAEMQLAIVAIFAAARLQRRVQPWVAR